MKHTGGKNAAVQENAGHAGAVQTRKLDALRSVLEMRDFMKAIVYTTNTGSTKRYAELLGNETGLPVYALRDAEKTLSPGAKILYLGWIMAGAVQGYSAAGRFDVQAVCAVGMGRTGTQVDSVRQKTALPGNIPLFTLQGNFDVKKLHGLYRLMMAMMVKTAGKALSKKENRTEDEDDMLDMMLRGGERVKLQNLNSVLA